MKHSHYKAKIKIMTKNYDNQLIWDSTSGSDQNKSQNTRTKWDTNYLAKLLFY